VDGVGQERNRAGEEDKKGLAQGRGAESNHADLYCSDTFSASRQRIVDGVGRVMAVRSKPVLVVGGGHCDS
jgi:hypothetical protein